MAPVQFAVESAVRHFFQQWFSGMQPMLNLETLPNGDITIDIKTRCSAADQHNDNSCHTNLHQTKRSGKGSRKRRKKRRHPSNFFVSPTISPAEPKCGNSSRDESAVYSNLPNVTSSSTFLPPMYNTVSSQSQSTLASNSSNSDIDATPLVNTQQPTSIQLSTPAIDLQTTTPSHSISFDELQQIMEQIRMNVGSSFEVEVSKMLKDQTLKNSY